MHSASVLNLAGLGVHERERRNVHGVRVDELTQLMLEPGELSVLPTIATDRVGHRHLSEDEIGSGGSNVVAGPS